MLEGISAAADLPTAAPMKVETFEKPDEGVDQKNYGEEKEPFVGEHPRQGIVWSDIYFCSRHFEINLDSSSIQGGGDG
jgi:hypothetical protein